MRVVDRNWPWQAAFLILFALAASSASCATYYIEGEDLTRHCRAMLPGLRKGGKVSADEAIGYWACHNFVMGVLDADLNRSADPRTYCIPERLKSNTIVEVVANYVDRKPEERHRPALALVRMALFEAYPCPASG